MILAEVSSKIASARRKRPVGTGT